MKIKRYLREFKEVVTLVEFSDSQVTHVRVILELLRELFRNSDSPYIKEHESDLVDAISDFVNTSIRESEINTDNE